MAEEDKEKSGDSDQQKGGLSRREWLIDIGKAAALASIAGKTGSLDAESLGKAAASEGQPAPLPAGLYRPSFDHLRHAIESESRYRAIPPGCQVDFIRPRTGAYEPQFFSRDEFKVIHRLTAVMLGEPAGPAGATAKSPHGNIVDEVAEWVDLHTYSFAGVRESAERLTPEQVALAKAYDGAPLLRRVRTTDPQKTYREGLAWLAEESKRRHQRTFVDLTEEQQTAILDLISDERADNRVDDEGTRFFRQLKGDIISGFYTSQTGLQELDDRANRFYAESPGCVNSKGNPPQAQSNSSL